MIKKKDNIVKIICVLKVLCLMTNMLQLNVVSSQRELQHIRSFVMNYIKNGTYMADHVNTEVGKTQIQVLLQ